MNPGPQHYESHDDRQTSPQTRINRGFQPFGRPIKPVFFRKSGLCSHHHCRSLCCSTASQELLSFSRLQRLAKVATAPFLQSSCLTLPSVSFLQIELVSTFPFTTTQVISPLIFSNGSCHSQVSLFRTLAFCLGCCCGCDWLGAGSACGAAGRYVGSGASCSRCFGNCMGGGACHSLGACWMALVCCSNHGAGSSPIWMALRSSSRLMTMGWPCFSMSIHADTDPITSAAVNNHRPILLCRRCTRAGASSLSALIILVLLGRTSA